MNTSEPTGKTNADNLRDQSQNPETQSPDYWTEDRMYEDCDFVAVLDSLVLYLRQYLVCDDHQFTILALWIVHTFTFKEFPTAAYLDISSPEPQCGKTRCLELLNQLCDSASFVTGASPATLINRLLSERSIEEIEFEDGELFYNPPDCHLLDDCQHTLGPSERQPLVAMLNSGSRKTTRYMLGSMEYSLFGPKAFAGNARLPRSLASRCIPIIFRRKKPSEAVARFDPDAPLPPEIAAARNSLNSIVPDWIAEFANETPHNLPPNLTAHQQDCAEPLLHVANAIGGHWPDRARAAIVAAFELCEYSYSLQMLEDVRDCFQLKQNPEYLVTRDLLTLLSDYENRPWSAWPRNSGRRLGALLQPFGIKSHTIKAEALKGYRFRDFKDAWERYLAPLTSLAEASSELALGNVSETASAPTSVTGNSTNGNELQAG